MTNGKVILRDSLRGPPAGESPYGERQEHSPPEGDDAFAQAVVDVAAEMDARRHWRGVVRDAARSACWLIALLRSRRRRG